MLSLSVEVKDIEVGFFPFILGFGLALWETPTVRGINDSWMKINVQMNDFAYLRYSPLSRQKIGFKELDK